MDKSNKPKFTKADVKNAILLDDNKKEVNKVVSLVDDYELKNTPLNSNKVKENKAKFNDVNKVGFIVGDTEDWFSDISWNDSDFNSISNDLIDWSDVNIDDSIDESIDGYGGLDSMYNDIDNESNIGRSEEYFDINKRDLELDYSLIDEQSDVTSVTINVKGVSIVNSNDIEKESTIDEAKKILVKIDLLFIEMSNLSKTGYVNDNSVDLPILRWFVNKYKLPIKEKKGFSIYLNVLFFNFIMVFLYNLVISIKTECADKLEKTDFKKHSDFIVDLNNTSKRILRMINPNIKNRLSNKGLSIIMSATVGFDTEFTHRSIGDLTNNLLSIQLAGSTGLVLKVPLIKEYSRKDFRIAALPYSNESRMCSYLHKSIKSMIDFIRYKLYHENDNLLNEFQTKLSTMDFNSCVIDDYQVFMIKNSEVKQLIKYPKEYKSSELVNDCESLNEGEHEKSLFYVIGLLNEVSSNEMSSRLSNCIKTNSTKPLSRITYRHKKSRLSITLNRVTYICAHESAADLSMLSDFKTFKENLDIVHRSFVTLTKPILLKDYKSKIHFRDTILLSPMGAKSLKAVGEIYGGEFRKIDLDPGYIKRMDLLLTENPELFERYAKQDAIVTLKHASTMEDFNLTVSKIGVPLTLSSVGKAYVLKEWEVMRFKGYQYGDDLNLSKLITPKGARSDPISNFIVPFIAGYRGGRNESYMYGIENCLDSKRSWFDYDLTSCYTTAMCLLGEPDYKRASYLFNATVLKMEDWQFLLNYIILDVIFEFKKDTKYPCIITRVDNDVDIYPLKGRSTITGPEYLAAKAMGCKLLVKSGVIIPFVHKEVTSNKKDTKQKNEDLSVVKLLPDLSWQQYMAPFRGIVTKLQQKRREFKKGTFNNYMYKEIGNSIYGQIAMGIGGKTTFDVKTKSYVKVEGSVLSSPVLASYITGFVRALIGECLNNIHRLGGKVISATTDGFITDIEDLESKILNLDNDSTKILLHLYRYVRSLLTYNESTKSFDDRGLEVKNVENNHILSCKTRVQFGSTDGGISAATGFQTSKLEKNFIIDCFSNIIGSTKGDKRIEYIQTSLRSASDIYNKGGNVVLVYRDRSFNLEYDNKRCIIENNSSSLLDTKPWDNIVGYEKIRVLKDSVTNPVYVKGLSTGQSKVYKTHLETSVRSFIKACLSRDIENRYGIPFEEFTNYQSIVDFVKSIDKDNIVKISKSSISSLKYRNAIARTVPRTEENESFIAAVKQRIPGFDTDLFFKELSDEARRAKKEQKDLSLKETKLIK